MSRQTNHGNTSGNYLVTHSTSSYKPSSQVEKLILDVYSSDERYITELLLLQNYLKLSDPLKAIISNIIQSHNSQIYLSTPENRKSWAIQTDVHYSNFIKLYKFNPDDAPQIIYLFKRPLARIRLMSKTFKVYNICLLYQSYTHILTFAFSRKFHN